MGVLRLGHVHLTVTDLELAAAYYSEVMGLLVTDRDDESVFLKCWDEVDHHSLRLRYGPRVGLELISWIVEHEADLAELELAITRFGLPVDRIDAGESTGQGASIRFATPSGHTMELVHDVERVGRLLPTVDPPPVPLGVPGVAPPRLDHVAVTAEEVGDATTFFTDVLGFRLTEQLLDGNGHRSGAWLERSHRPHDLAIVAGPNGGLHHLAFRVDDWDAVRRAADLMAAHGITVEAGPMRQGVARALTLYVADPLGTRNEVVAGGYRPDPDFPTITWTESSLERAFFSYEGVVGPLLLKAT